MKIYFFYLYSSPFLLFTYLLFTIFSYFELKNKLLIFIFIYAFLLLYFLLTCYLLIFSYLDFKDKLSNLCFYLYLLFFVHLCPLSFIVLLTFFVLFSLTYNLTKNSLFFVFIYTIHFLYFLFTCYL